MSNFNLPDIITYWTQKTTDANSTVTYNRGKAIAGRWMRKDGTVTDDKGKTQATTELVYAETLIPKRAKIALGDYNRDATPHSSSRIVLGSTENPSMTDLTKMVM